MSNTIYLVIRAYDECDLTPQFYYYNRHQADSFVNEKKDDEAFWWAVELELGP